MTRPSMMRGLRGPVVGALAFTTLLLIAMLSIGAAYATAPDQTADPMAVWSQFVAALNTGDAASAARLFSEEALFQQPDTGCATPCLGRTAIMQQLQQTIAHRPVVSTIEEVTVVENEVSGRLRISDPATGSWTVSFSMATAGGMIAALRLAAPIPGSLVSAGSGGLIRPESVDAHLPLWLTLIGTLLGGFGVILLRRSAQRPHGVHQWRVAPNAGTRGRTIVIERVAP